MVGQRDRKVKSFLEGSRCDALNSRLETRLAHHEPLRDTMKVATERTILVHVGLPGRWSDPKNPFGEIAAVVEAAGAEVVGTISQKLSKPSAKTLIRKGKVQELAAAVKCCPPACGSITTSHCTNSRTRAGLRGEDSGPLRIDLDIFAIGCNSGSKAQVEIAQLQYTYPRLRAMWDHLGQVVRAAPVGIGTRGPGETQLEIDRRLARDRLPNYDESWPKCNAERVAKWPIEPRIISRWAWWVTPTRGKARSSTSHRCVCSRHAVCHVVHSGRRVAFGRWRASLGL